MSDSPSISATPLSHAIAQRLRQQILLGHWPPGTELQDSDIARSLGVSRTPVREAMHTLRHEGLLTAQPRRGMRIAQLSAAQIQEAQDLHAWLAHYVQHNPTPAPSLAQQMLHMASQRLQLAALCTSSLPLGATDAAPPPSRKAYSPACAG